jgi:hypothetical protein
LGGHLSRFSAIHAHPSCRFHLAVDFLGLRRNGSSSQITNQAQNFLEQFLRHGNLGHLEGDIPAMADDLATDLYELLS